MSTDLFEIAGRCPSCREQTLVATDDGKVSCTYYECPAPMAAHELLTGASAQARGMLDWAPLLTIAEQNAIDLAAKLWNSLVGIVGHGPTRDSDLAELCAHIHAIQHAVMAQGVARAYPNDYRPAGGTVGDPS